MSDVALMTRLREAAQIVADDAKRRSARWSRRVPLSVRLIGGRRSIVIAAGGQRAPQAYTMEGRNSGRPISHPVFGRPDRARDTWTWVPQTPRPFLREAIDFKQDEMLAAFAKVIDDWAQERGWKGTG
jgi:hypothetical protein